MIGYFFVLIKAHPLVENSAQAIKQAYKEKHKLVFSFSLGLVINGSGQETIYMDTVLYLIVQQAHQ